MFAKLCTLVLPLGALGGTLLAVRHARLQAGSEAAQAQLRIRRCDDRLCSLRAEVSRRIAPLRIEQIALESGIGPLHPATNDLPRSLLGAAGAEETAGGKSAVPPGAPGPASKPSKQPTTDGPARLARRE